VSSFTFSTIVPAAPNNPSADQPIMLTNNISTNALVAIDHVSFNVTGGGQHKQVTFNNKNVPGVQTDPGSTLYTNSGTASTVADLFFRNQNGTFQVLPIKAWALCSTAGIVATQSINITTVVKTGTGQYTVNLTPGAVTGTNYGVLVTAGANGGTAITGNYTALGVNTFNLLFKTPTLFADPSTFLLAVIQV